MLIGGMPIHRCNQSLDSLGIDDRALGIVRPSHHAQGIGSTHLNALVFRVLQHGGDDAVNVPCMQQLRCCFRPQSETREDPQAMLLDQGEVDIEAHDLQSNLDATMLHDQRPALLVTGDGCQEIHPLGDEFHGARIRGPSICRRTDGVENRGNALGMIQPRLDGGAVGTQRCQALQSQCLDMGISRVPLHDVEKYRDDAGLHQGILAAIVLRQFIDHTQRADGNLRIARVILQGVFHRGDPTSIDDLRAVLGDVGQGG
mmetsp:Transcript_70113/g.141853  ORF Transcript_70113/g.141853 Transcript_70113/m.141853 type:complete len:258 (-) Transcript_70113:759-1532(-)